MGLTYIMKVKNLRKLYKNYNLLKSSLLSLSINFRRLEKSILSFSKYVPKVLICRKKSHDNKNTNTWVILRVISN